MEDEWKKLDYDKSHILGQGGYAIVFKGRLIKNNGDDVQVVDVAIKRLEKKLNHQIDEMISMEREFVIQKKLNHPNVVKLLHIKQDENFLYFALELCEASLDRVFLPENDPEKYKGPLPTDIDFMLQLSLGLQYIHSENLVHRDIKPGNVLIFRTSTGEAVMKWSDFGLSKETNREGEYSLSGYRGTQNYLAPEILVLGQNDQLFTQEKSDVSNKKIILTNMSDVFSCALVFFKYFTKGCHPFGTNEEIISNIRQSNPVNLKELPRSHFAFRSIKKMLSKQIEERPNLREIILLLNCIHKVAEMYPNRPIDEVFQELNQLRKELYDLCSIPVPDEAQIEQINRIVTEDTIGLINIVDEDGHSPLLLVCRNMKSTSLLSCVKVIARKNYVSSSRTVDLNYRNRENFNALHCVSMNYEGFQLHELKNQIVQHSIERMVTDDVFLRNTKFFTSVISQRGLENYLSDTTDHYLAHTGVDLNVNDTAGQNAHLVDLVTFFIDHGMDVTTKRPDGSTVLHLLCRYYIHEDLFDLVKLLLDQGVDVNAKDSEGWTTLHLLLRYYSQDNLVCILELFIKNGADVKVKLSNDDYTLLHILCRYYPHSNLIDLANYLLVGNGVDINAKRSSDEWTALHILCCGYLHDNLVDVFRWFIEKGVDLNAKDSDGINALQLILTFRGENPKLIELVRLLTDNGVDVAIPYNHPDGWSSLPLHFLFGNKVHYSDENLIDLVELLTPGGWTVLHSFCVYYEQKNLIDIVRSLIGRGTTNLDAKIPDGNTALHLLCQYYIQDDLIDLIRLLIENGADVNAKDSDGRTVLHFLCSFYTHANLFDLVKLFLDQGTDANAQQSNGVTALYILCGKYSHNNLIDLLQLLIDSGADFTLKDLDDEAGMTAIHSLIMNDDQRDNLAKIVQFLIDKGIDVNIKSSTGLTAFDMYLPDEMMDMASDDVVSAQIDSELVKLLTESYENSQGKLIDLVRLFIENGVDVRLIESEGVTTIYFLNGNYTNDNLLDLVRLLVDEQRLDINKAKTFDGWTALHFLCRYYSDDTLIDIFKWLVTKGVDLNEKLPDGRNFLHLLCQYYSKDNLIELVELLLNDGVNINEKSSDGWTALHFLCQNYHHENLIEIVSLLIEKKANINSKTSILSKKLTALHLLCCKYRHGNLIDLVRLMVYNGVEINEKDSTGWTALHFLCAHYTHNDLIGIIKLLFDHGAEVNLEDTDETPLLILLCCSYSFDNLIDLVKLLIRKGIDVNAKIKESSRNGLHILCQEYKHYNLVDLVELLIDKGVDAHGKAFKDGVTALHLLCMNKAQRGNLINVVQLLIKKGVKVTLTDSNFRTPLAYLRIVWKADGEIDPKLVKLLGGTDGNQPSNTKTYLTRLMTNVGVETNLNEFDGMMTTFYHMFQGNRENLGEIIKVLDLLIQEGSLDIDGKSSNGWTALHLFILRYPHDNLIELVKFLIDKGADAKAMTSDGFTALSILCSSYSHENLFELAQLLIDHGVDLTTKHATYGWNALHLLCSNKAALRYRDNFLKIVGLLISRGVDVNLQTSYAGVSAFHILCQEYSQDNLLDLVKLLIEDGIDVTLKDFDSCTALHHLCESYVHSNLIDLVRLMIETGIDINVQTLSNRSTALHYLCQHYTHDNLIDLLRLFIENSADINSKNSDGWTALHILC